MSGEGDLTSDDLFDILSELHPIRSKWYNFGLGLRLKSHDLDANPGKDASECLREVLKLCLVQINPRPSWEGIVKALRSEAVNEKPLAEKLEQTYCPRSRARASSTSVQAVNPQVEPPLDHSGGSDHNGSPTTITSGVLTRRRPIKPDHDSPDPQPQPHLRYDRTKFVCGVLGFIITIALLVACIPYMPNFYTMVAVETDKEPLSTIWHHNTKDSPHTVKSTDHDTGTGTTIRNSKEPEQTQQAAKSNGAGCKPIENVNEVIDALSNDISDWKYLGEELGLTSTTLDRIKLDQHNELHKLKETIRTWYQTNPDNSCWEVVIRALTKMAMNRIARVIADKQGLDWKQFTS